VYRGGGWPNEVKAILSILLPYLGEIFLLKITHIVNVLTPRA